MCKKTLIILLMTISLNTYSQEIAKCYTTELIENELITNLQLVTYSMNIN
jgi:hypothetical protein